MVRRGYLLVGCLWLLASMAPAGQEHNDLAFLMRMESAMPTMIVEPILFDSQETSELKLLSTGLIRLYQKFVSSQDLPACNFTPTCSRFGMGAIQRYGMLRGILLTADRLLRDNGCMMHYHYPHDASTGKFSDPVSKYAPEALR